MRAIYHTVFGRNLHSHGSTYTNGRGRPGLTKAEQRSCFDLDDSQIIARRWRSILRNRGSERSAGS